MPSLLELQDLYNEALVREIIEKTKAAGVVWNHIGGTQFSATNTEGQITWDFYVTKTQNGKETYLYNLDIKKNEFDNITVQEGT